MSRTASAFRLAWVNLSPAIKRIFWWQPEIYAFISFSAVLAVIGSAFSAKRAMVSVLLFAWVWFMVSPSNAVRFLSPFVIWIFARNLYVKEIEEAFLRLRYIFFVSFLYALYQKQFGYLPHEMQWIMNEVGTVTSEGYFASTGLRPFSFYAGVPEFGFFSSIFVYLGIRRKSFVIFSLGLSSVFLAGSRGILVSLGIALLILLFERHVSKRNAVLIGFVLSVLMYALISIWLPISGLVTDLSVGNSNIGGYGTFNARIEILMDLVEKMNSTNIWYAVGDEKGVYDNFYLTLLNDFGLLGMLFFLWYIVKITKTTSGMFFSVMLLSYSFYSDALFSAYFSYNAMVLMLAKE